MQDQLDLYQVGLNKSLPTEPVLGGCFHITVKIVWRSIANYGSCARKTKQTQTSHHCLKRTLFQISVLSISEKGMLSDGVIFLHGNTHTAFKTEESLHKFKWEVWNHSPYSPDSASNLDSNYLSGARLSSDSDVEIAAENWLNG
ncbi:hypothetical protein AVEN_85219-1 [Araneus ventricosus]|uniref:Tc1-like transposase DDE domain-containing protein n=1 Tax=Araneus ventricosus TaxID=182803 RepID=A0A4Y2EEB1_ARAVE|nr:hypothetical protein AVEN_85219-1 [Araneus ventricosus]